jgi:hypothetical protein
MKVYSENPTPLSKTDLPSYILQTNRRGLQQIDVQLCSNNRDFLNMLCGSSEIVISGMSGRGSTVHPLAPIFTNAMAEDTRELLADVKTGKRKFSSLLYHARGLLASIADDTMKVELIDARKHAMATAINAIADGHRNTMSKIMNAVRVVLGKDIVKAALDRLKASEPQISPVEGAFLSDVNSVGTQADQILSRYDAAKDSPRAGIFISAGPIKAWVQTFFSDRSSYRRSIVTPELVKDWRVIGYMIIDLGTAANAFTVSPAIAIGDKVKSKLEETKTTLMEVPVGNSRWAMKRIKQAATEEEARVVYTDLSADFGDLVKFASIEMGKISPDSVNLDHAVSTEEVVNYMARMTGDQLDEMAAVAEKPEKK